MQNQEIVKIIENLGGRRGYEEKRASKLGFTCLYDYFEYKISKKEFEELLNDVTEELQREDELLEEEIWELERAEAMERERLIHQIDDFESWEEQRLQQNSNPSTYISPLLSNSNNLTSPLVTCPICNSSSLKEAMSRPL